MAADLQKSLQHRVMSRILTWFPFHPFNEHRQTGTSAATKVGEFLKEKNNVFYSRRENYTLPI